MLCRTAAYQLWLPQLEATKPGSKAAGGCTGFQGTTPKLCCGWCRHAALKLGQSVLTSVPGDCRQCLHRVPGRRRGDCRCHWRIQADHHAYDAAEACVHQPRLHTCVVPASHLRQTQTCPAACLPSASAHGQLVELCDLTPSMHPLQSILASPVFALPGACISLALTGCLSPPACCRSCSAGAGLHAIQ